MHINRKSLIVSSLALGIVCLSGCLLKSESTDQPTDQPTDHSAEDAKKSDAVVILANGDLEKNVAHMTNLDQFKYGKEDLTELKSARAGFEDAVKLDPKNTDAKMGLALTGFLLAAQSKKLSDVVNQSLEAKSPFDTKVTETAPQMRIAVLKRVAAAAQFPEFHVIQDAIADTLLPALDEAITYIKAVYDDPAFSMTLTIEDKPRELDHAEAGILLAGFHAIRGLLTLWLSYDIDIDDNGSYDYLATLEEVGKVDDFGKLTTEQRAAFNQLTKLLGSASPFMAVRPEWKAKLAGVDDEINLALDLLKSSLTSIKSESDAQADDLLHLCIGGETSECIHSKDFDQATAIVDSAIKYMSHPYEFAVPGIDTTININFAAFFNVQDYKKLLPYYGFYNANDWSDAKPVLYFTDRSGKETGNIKDLIKIGEDADSLGTPVADIITKVRVIVHLQDPTFQGFLPGATEDGVWSLVRKLAEKDTASTTTVATTTTMDSHFALSLLGSP